MRALTQNVGVIGTGGAARPPTDVINASPIVGKANIRTTAIAQRLEDPKAIEAKDYTAATRHDAVNALLRLADQLRAEDGGVTPGLFEGIDVYGVRDDPFLGPGNTTQRVPLATFITDRPRLAQLLTTPVRTRTVPGAAETLPDEGAYFSDSADLSDNTVALMRQVEGRIRLYRDAIAAAQATLATLREGIAQGNAGLAAIADALAEARHDVSVAKALLAEESERIADINQRRARVIAEEVRFLAFVRPREADNLASVPRHQVDPGLIEAPAPGCLDDHPDVPDELTGLLRVVREAPAQWFVDVPRLFDRLDRPDLLVKAVQSAQIRTPLLAASIAQVAAPSNRLTGAIASMQSRQLQVVSQARAVATQIDLTRVRGLTWQGARDQATQVVSLGDLVDGEHGRGEVSRRAAQTFEEIGRITACLHAGFSGVLPSLRLDWAETLSQFDDSPSLRRLSALARWGEIPYLDRYRLQGLVDWLFSRINPVEPRAESLMNDVVRMCLLLASHAPVGRIIAGRLPRPITVRPGVRLPLTAFDPTRLRVGMEALVYRELDRGRARNRGGHRRLGDRDAGHPHHAAAARPRCQRARPVRRRGVAQPHRGQQTGRRHAVSAVMARATRIVQRLQLRADSESAVRRALPVLEDAFRTATLPDLGARLVFVRRLNLGTLPHGASAQSLSLLLESRFSEAGLGLVHAADAPPDTNHAVWFRDSLQAHELAALHVAAGRPVAAWFWPLAVPALAGATTPGDRLRAIAFSLAALDEAPAALPAWTTSLVRAGHGEQLIGALRPGDGAALLRAAGASHAAVRTRKASARPIAPCTGGPADGRAAGRSRGLRRR